MKTKKHLDFATLQLEEYSKIQLTTSEVWENELELKLKQSMGNRHDSQRIFRLIFGLLFIVNITVLVFSMNKEVDAKVTHYQDLKMLREELLIPNSL